ncbi:MAG: SUMF1/EgtB/PvdO family nonheme iron enzyme, partial [Candidatus Brocadiaceae bacterium]
MRLKARQRWGILLSLAFTLALTLPPGASGGQQPDSWRPRPAPDDAQVQPCRVRVVDAGTDFLRDGDGRPVHQFHVHRYRLTRDGQTGLWRPEDDYALDRNHDVDGDGRTDDDVVGHYPFSLSRPFSPVAPWYDRLAGTPGWYGAAAIFQANRRETRFSESGVNQEHDGPLHLPRDNWALFHEGYEVNSPYRAYGLWIWKKDDFLNGGADHRVSFDEGSEMALYLQRYWMGWEGCRWLVKDGDRFYLSEGSFRGAGQRRGSGDGKQHVIAPAAARWAEYTPRPPHDIAFDPGGATFRRHRFTDVRAVGWYLYKDRFIPAYTGFKWYAFEVDAVVRRPERPSEHIEMAQVDGKEGLPPFYMSTCEVPYELWKNVFRLARSNTFVRDPRGFIFRTDGDMGSMDLPAGTGRLVPHSPQEPVTDLTLHDVAAWCNALSTLESRTPCYYVDAELRRPFRFVTRSAACVEERPLPPLHVRWEADGYRLPTASEWRAALGGERPGPENGWLAANSGGRTRPVGGRPANAHGMYDMAGNVWELCWTRPGAFDPHGDEPILALGADFRYPGKPVGCAASLFGEAPYGGNPCIGFRLVRREAGLPAPASVEVPEDVPAWRIDRSEPGSSDRPLERPALPPVGTVSVPGRPFEIAPHETTFAEWREVYRWAVANGYTFDHDGDMGSMDYWGFGGQGVRGAHSPDEPVTDVSAYDAMVWCNALSELAGREPVYYADSECTRPYRDAFVHRPLMMLFFEAHRADEAGTIRYDHREAYEDVHVRPDADGYRLPTHEEFTHARTAGRGTRYSWGDEPAEGAEHAWLFDTAGCTTHPVGTGRANPFGLHDMEGNVS